MYNMVLDGSHAWPIWSVLCHRFIVECDTLSGKPSALTNTPWSTYSIQFSNHAYGITFRPVIQKDLSNEHRPMGRGQSSRRSRTRLLQPNAWIEVGIEQVRDQVGEGKDQHSHQGDGLQHGQVATVDGKGEQAAQPRIVEDVLDHDQSADEP